MYRAQPQAIVLAARAAMGCNRFPVSIRQRNATMPHRQRPALPFESRSVALFTTLVLAAGLSAAQSGSPAPASADAIPANKWTVAQIADAFRKTDTDGSGSISRQEAAMWSGLVRNFDRLDSNKDGQLSQAEFNEGLK
jgi:hypothetical protein